MAEDNKTLPEDLSHLAKQSARGLKPHAESNIRDNTFMAARPTVIAIIDDDPGIRDALECLLWTFGYRTESYSSAEEFISATTVTEASCLLVDIQLGETSGVELCRHLSTTGFTFRIIFITGSRDETLWKQAMDFGCVAYLLKPFSADQLSEALSKAIGGDRAECNTP